MPPFDFAKGNDDYLAAMATDPDLPAKYADLQRDHTTLAEKHEALFVRFDGIANDTDETEYLRKRVRRELVLHIEEWTS